jgi:integrase
MKARDEELQNLRTSGNVRRQHRHEKLLPLLPHYGDHLTPAALLSVNTGLRRGEVLKLRWTSIDFNRRLLTVEGRNAKNRQTRHVPLNEEAVNTLRLWREQSGPGAHAVGHRLSICPDIPTVFLFLSRCPQTGRSHFKTVSANELEFRHFKRESHE